MVDYPWTFKPSSLEDFLKNMPNRPEPTTGVTQSYLASLGYTSSSDRQIIPILRFINFVDSKGRPNEQFKNFRDTSKSKAIMAQALKESYSALFGTIPSPWQASDVDLENFFRTATGRGGRMLTATVSALKTLCQFADFGAPAIPTTPIPAPAPAPAPTPSVQLPLIREGIPIVNVNIHVELPVTQDADVYDKIFQALKRHLLTPSSKTD